MQGCLILFEGILHFFFFLPLGILEDFLFCQCKECLDREVVNLWVFLPPVFFP